MRRSRYLRLDREDMPGWLHFLATGFEKEALNVDIWETASLGPSHEKIINPAGTH